MKCRFYYGVIEFKNEIYNGKHEALISKDLFDLTQRAFRKDNKPKHAESRNFLLAGMIKCANCGCLISGEIKKGKYIYYSCTGAKGKCDQKHIYIREEKLEKQLLQAIQSIAVSEKYKSWINQALAESFKDEQAYTKERIKSLSTQRDQLRDRVSNIYLDKLDGKIGEEFWLERHNQWTSEILSIQNKLLAFESANINFIEQGSKFLKICSEIKELYLYADNEEKKELMNYVLQNSTLDGEKVHYEYKKPFDLFAKGLNRLEDLG